MKLITSLPAWCVVMMITVPAVAQVEIDQSIQLTGGSGQSAITGLVDAPVNGTDAVNKDYVDNAVAAGGGGLNSPTMMSNVSPTTMTWFAALTYCGNLSEGGYTDWYLPGMREMAEFFKNNGVVPNNADGYLWLNFDDSNFIPSSNQAPIVYYGSGWAFASSSPSTLRPARCVR
jgi:hypothetical protein